jgi:hypothetical protein
MALAILFAKGRDSVEAMKAIRQARSIAVMVSARDAVGWFHTDRGSPAPIMSADETRPANWLPAKGNDPQSAEPLIWAMTDGAVWCAASTED